MAEPSAIDSSRDLRTRPRLWRLPLVAFVVFGLAFLQQLDRLVVREYRTEAVTQAVQTDALLESFFRQRIATLHSLAALVGSAPSRREAGERFRLLTREIAASSPDVLWLYLLDGTGVVRDVYPQAGDAPLIASSDHLRSTEQSRSLERAAASRRTSTTGTLRYASGGSGILAYEPIVRADTLAGYVGAAFVYRTLFNNALAGQLQGQFAYRILDEAGRVIALSPNFPSRASQTVVRDVRLTADRRWTLELAIPRFQPLIPRLVMWAVGVLLLLLVIFLVLREQARAERFALHSYNLEILSRDLLDANVRLEERAQQVAEANRAKSRFLANVSHELRTPLNAIVGYNALALDGIYGALTPPLRAAHERIKAAGAHLLGLVDDVLDLSKIEVGRMEVSPEPVDVSAVLESVATVIQPIAAAKDVTVRVGSASDVPQMHTDPRHLRQILLNLASNAIKFTERGSVSITARPDRARPATHVQIAVQDTGIGIAQPDLSRIFDEFEQVRPGGRGDSLERGTGLGLTISRKLARLLGGDVRAESRLGSGSRFTVTLPLEAPGGTSPHATPAFVPAFRDADVEQPLSRGRDVIEREVEREVEREGEREGEHSVERGARTDRAAEARSGTSPQ
jgi:signal transduction histidine kinase